MNLILLCHGIDGTFCENSSARHDSKMVEWGIKVCPTYPKSQPLPPSGKNYHWWLPDIVEHKIAK